MSAKYRLIAENPVAGARFFHFIVEMFIKHVLGVNQGHPGLYGNTAECPSQVYTVGNDVG